MSDETRAAFRKFAGMTYVYFGKDINSVPADTRTYWEKEAGSFPPEFYEWAIEHVKSMDSGRTVLSNLPKVVKDLWGQWLRANPNRVERHEFSGCNNPHCEDGRFWVFREHVIRHPDGTQTSILVKLIAICAECRQLGREMLVGMTRSQAEHVGFILPRQDLEDRYQDQQGEIFAAAWDRFAELRQPRFALEDRG